ncbi:type I-E CRISPR-associated protein Cse2/CasB [Isoptericola sp. BMS4]|uniref:type I-E CRISPR-associated protein Cse2/CasB n=1 Tax=Isoptericola sp. BMS4 TaxID=2527875 RepID=UPI00141F99E8|nr:type I-E CRISPR-associated protein Cse2/CasB [Isoptericola sp. BMS4]
MTTTEAPEGAVEETRRRGRRLGDTGRYVARRATMLQEGRHRSRTVAALAHLRANVGKEPGSDPAIWWLTVDGVPGKPHGDDPTREERAVHAALTLYAVHQQARSEAMHRPGVGLGHAVASLERNHGDADADRTSPVRRRFDAVVTATDVVEVTHHLRGLVTQMRGAGIGFDYGQLADDFVDFQRPGRQDDVRRRWARQIYHQNNDTTEERS